MAQTIGNADAEREIIQAWCDSLSVLDDVFDSFVTTTVYRGRRVSWDELRTTSHTHKRYLTYEHLSIPYLATVFLHDTSRADWINIKLNCNGFMWPTPPLSWPELPHPRHNTTGWVVLPDGDFFSSAFPRIAQRFNDADGVALYYALDAQRLDMKIFYDDGRPHAEITFEMGYPFYDDIIDDAYVSRRRW